MPAGAPLALLPTPPINALMPAEEPVSRRDRLWADCRNGLGIARLLVHEGRPEGLVSTACRVAVESACRAALEHLGLPYDGDLDRALGDLKVEAEWCASAGAGPADRSLLLAAERTVGSIAAFLREAEPARSWGY
jgi:hypothetical protein